METTVSKEMMKGTIVPIILKLLNERDMYGYELIQVVNERTDNVLQWKEGTIYPWLHRLESDGTIRGQWRTQTNGRRRKYYGLTRKGVHALETKSEEWKVLAKAVNTLLFQPA